MILYGPVCSQDCTQMAMHRASPMRHDKPYNDYYEKKSALSVNSTLSHERSSSKPILAKQPYDIRNDQVKFTPPISSSETIFDLLREINERRAREYFIYLVLLKIVI